jgi:curved DNA-binding protein CbpA
VNFNINDKIMYDIDKCYEILGVNVGASIEEVKQSYRDLVKIWHPDRFDNDPRLQKKASEKLKEINRAYNDICSYINYHDNNNINFNKAC